ncbi:LOW QUALITY PROTEIN: A disintegrin and metalloproteinase with thrombospondin motifs 7 [Morone saxatilis]|uniref:LOW QUALITY PROTEIN: A disintegrin and metalloproteinase with thrombospondin motifs 7 n=1 Tax=Morone saxatilis TaxID=34816 RepID=UPI0015E239A0|nr:LOW QUALITY PROTEIN: A disintegrin and metalloproteinase with thrombospondin motifs 7 [Morone saxatilis]
MTRLDCGRHAFGQGLSPIHFCIALLMILENCRTLGLSHEPERFLQNLPQYEVVHPIRVDARGHFLSNFLSHHARRVQRREASEGPVNLDRVFYQFRHGGYSLHFNLTLNPHLLAPGFLTERRYGGLEGAQIHPSTGSFRCHFLGDVWDQDTVKGSAAISTCDGLTGLFKLSDEEFFIQPVEKSSDESSAPRAHAIYKRHTSSPHWSPVVQPISGNQALNGTCGIKNSHQSFEDIERQRERWEHRQQRRRRRIHQRSVSKEKWVETLVVADPKMVEYHGSKAVESYVLAVMNIVAGLFRDASIGNAINIVVVRLILLEQDEDDLKITHHADNSLNSFCKWQKKLNMKGEEHPLHHDVSVLLTRKDICASINMPCETLGLSHVAGMCQPHRSCSISEDTGLPLAFTVAHELGHNFGIQHDGNGNDCEPIGKRPFVMSPQLLYGTSLPRWSRCSRQYITRFLDRGWGWCLDDAPVKEKLSLNSVLPGVLYSAAHQCRLQYGSGSLLCDDMDNVCSTLWCTVGTTCHSKLDGAVDGTSCGEDKWCFSGECVATGYQPESVNGGWASWSEWSGCSRTCGAGVRSAHRDCDNPVPKYGGKYCLGERRRYKICNTPPCPNDLPTFRDIQCSHFNTMPYKGKFYKWEAVINRVSPCELHCRPLNEHFSEKMRDAVTDGTPCYEGNKSRDMCINGICKNVGCDYLIESNAVEDRCGVCDGNGSTCTTVRRTFEESEGLGYVDIGLIPEGAWGIRIEEVAEAGNFLALRSDNPNKYFLNGGWTIQWNGEYKAAGTVFTYERTGHLENLTSPGPTMEPLWIQLLFQETNPGVRYEYTISQNVSQGNDIPESVFSWKYGSWTECSVTCGTGVQRQIVHCVEKTTGIVEAHFCDPLTRPDNNQTSCNKDPCPAIWWVGEWHKCSASCGSSGQTKRTVLCIQAVSVEEQKALQPSECEHMLKPESLSSCNTHIPCPADWTTGSWSKCSLTCGSGVRRRNVTCSRNTGVDCDPQKKPLAVTTCYIQDCPQVVDNFGIDWSGSGWSSKEVLNEINSIPDVKPPPKYSTTRAQPRNQNNLNNIVEGDFHYHNNIENIDRSPENSVQVDDFYYDYNFINFHEDLSDDFEGDGKDSGDSHRFSAPQEAKPTRSVKENAYMENKAPTATSAVSTTSKATAYTVKAEDPESRNLDNVKDNENAATKEFMQTNSENLDDFLSEDYLLPVSTNRSPPSTTQHSQTLKERHDNLWRPENISTIPDLIFTTKEPTQDVKWEQYGKEAQNNFENFTAEDNPTENVTVTPKHAAPTPGHETTIDNFVSTTISAQETKGHDDYEYSYDEKSTLVPDISADQEGEESPEPLGSPTPGTITQVKTEVQLDKSVSEIPQTTSQSTIFPTTFTLEDLDLDQTGYATSQYSWDTDPDLSTTSLPASERSSPLPIPFVPISGNQEASEDSTSFTGTEIIPPTNLEGATQPSPADFLPATMEQIPTKPAFTERTGTDSTSQSPSFDLADFDYNEIVVPMMVRSSSSDPGPSHQLPTNTAAAPKHSTTPAVPSLPTNQPILLPLPVPTSVQTSASTHVTTAAYWVTGNWSACSTSCGLGAIWRTLACSTGSDSDCDPAKRPAPAQRCYLRPCSTWKVEEWSKCSKNCEGGVKSREVQCFDMRDQRPLRPFHCRAMSSRPQTQIPCNLQPCLEWYSSSWGQCSEVCGGGEQQRIVACPEEDRCNRDLQPSNIQSCHSQSCTQWLTGSWGQCSASCGGGVQRRLIKCVNTKADEEVDQAQCDHEPQPESLQKCNLQECERAPSGTQCVRDRLTFRFCQTLRWLGRCHLPNIRAQCCKTCSQRSRSSSTSRR